MNDFKREHLFVNHAGDLLLKLKEKSLSAVFSATVVAGNIASEQILLHFH